MGPGAAKAQAGFGTQLDDGAGAYGFALGAHVDLRPGLNGVVTQIVFLVVVTPEGVLALLVVALVKGKKGF